MKLIFVRFILVISAIAPLLYSCGIEKTDNLNSRLDSLTLSDTAYHDETSYFYYTVNTLVLKPDNVVNNRINKSLIFEIFNIETDSYSKAFEKSFEEESSMYMETVKELGPMEHIDQFVVTADVNKLLFSDNLKTFSIYKYSFTGGAHGNYSTALMNFDKDGNKLKLGDITNDKRMLTDIGRQEFYRMFNLEEGKPINEQGYWFDRDEFYLPDNFAFTKEYLLFIYNPYEVASYAQGEIELRLPYSKVKKVINSDLIPNN